MSSLIGSSIGGFLITLLIGTLIERFFFRDLKPTQRAAFTIGAAWVLCAFLAGFGFANGGSFAYGAGFFYLPGALVSFFLFRRRYQKAWSE